MDPIKRILFCYIRCCLKIEINALIIQWLEYHTFNVRVPGSNPGQRTNISPRRLVRIRTPGFHPGNTGSNPVEDARDFK